MHMSTRLIKHNQHGESATFALFAFPERGQGPARTLTLNASPLFPFDSSVDPNSDVETQLRKADSERETREDGERRKQSEIMAAAARITEPLCSQFKETFAELAALRKTMTARAERELIRLSIEIAKTIVHREVTTDNEVVMTLVRMALSRLQNRTAARVVLNPEDFAYVNEHLERLETNHAIDLVSDPAIGRGGCLVQTDLGDVDARVEQQFAEIERSLLGNLSEP